MRVGIVDGPIAARMIGNWSRCSFVSDVISRRERSTGPMAFAPNCGSALRAVVDRLVRTPTVGNRLGQQPPLAHRREHLLKQDQCEERPERAEHDGRWPVALLHERRVQQVARIGHVEDVHQAEQVNDGVGEEVDEARPAVGVHLVPRAADAFVEPLVQQHKPADHGGGGGDQQRHADAVAVPRHVGGEVLSLRRVVNGLPAAFDLVPFHVNEHVGETRRDAHRQRQRGAHQRDGRQRARGHPADDEQRGGEQQVHPPVRPREPPLPDAEPTAHRPAGRAAEQVERPPEDAGPVEQRDEDADHDERGQNGVRGEGLVELNEPGRGHRVYHFGGGAKREVVGTAKPVPRGGEVPNRPPPYSRTGGRPGSAGPSEPPGAFGAGVPGGPRRTPSIVAEGFSRSTITSWPHTCSPTFAALSTARART